MAENDRGYRVDQVIKALRELDQDYTSGHSEVLIRLRDEPTINKYVSLFVESEGTNRRAGTTLGSSYSPWIIPLLIDIMDAQEIERMRHPHPEFSPYWGLSGETARIIRGLLMSSNEFPDELRLWAEGLPYHGTESLRELRDTLTVWWEENEAHFENEEYNLVKPVSWDLDDDAERDQEEERDLESTQEPEEHDLGLEEEESEESLPQSSDEEPEMEQSGRFPWPWALGAAVLILLAMGVLKMRSKGSGS